MKKPVRQRALMTPRPINLDLLHLVQFCTPRTCSVNNFHFVHTSYIVLTFSSTKFRIGYQIRMKYHHTKHTNSLNAFLKLSEVHVDIKSWFVKPTSKWIISLCEATFLSKFVLYFYVKYRQFQIMMPSGKVLAKMWNVSMSFRSQVAIKYIFSPE